APVQLAAVPVLGAAHFGIDGGDRRGGGRMDRRHARHRRIDYPGHVQFRLGLAVFRDHDECVPVGRLLPDRRRAGARHRALATRERALRQITGDFRMSNIGDMVQQPAREVSVAAKADVVVVGGGPAGLSAALAAARNGAQVILLERYSHLGGLASGGMVLVLDDMWDNHQREISVRGTCMSMIERMDALKLVAYPRENEWGQDPASVRRWSRWGTFDFHSHDKPQPICFAASFDPDAWKRVSLEMVEETGITLRLHSWFSQTLVEDGKVK